MPTVRDVAKDAGVSPTTVSFVLNGRAQEMHIGEAATARVRESAAKLGYDRNYHARALRRGRSNVLGLVMNMPLHNRWWNMIAAGVQEAANAAASNLLIVGPTANRLARTTGEQCLREKQVDALVCIGGYNAPDPANAGNNPRAVVIYGDVAPYPWIAFDAAPGLEAAVAHLANLSHRSLAYLGKRDGRKIMLKHRLDAVRKAARQHKVDLQEVFVAAEERQYSQDFNYHLKHDYEQLRALPDSPGAATAVLCYNDTLAMALVNLMRERGVRVPEDLSVVGFDDMHATHCLPALTTVSHMLPELGAKGVEVALKLVEDAPLPSGKVEVAAELVVRESTAPPRRKPGRRSCSSSRRSSAQESRRRT